MIIKTVEATIQRRADHGAYAANDSVSDSDSAPTPLVFKDVFPASGARVWVAKATLVEDQVPTTAGQFNLWLIRGAAAPTAVADNAAFSLADDAVLGPTNRVLDYINFSSGKTLGASYFYSYNTPPLLLEGYSGAFNPDLYALVSVDNAYDPSANSGKLVFRLTIEQDI